MDVSYLFVHPKCYGRCTCWTCMFLCLMSWLVDVGWTTQPPTVTRLAWFFCWDTTSIILDQNLWSWTRWRQEWNPRVRCNFVEYCTWMDGDIFLKTCRILNHQIYASLLMGFPWYQNRIISIIVSFSDMSLGNLYRVQTANLIGDCLFQGGYLRRTNMWRMPKDPSKVII